MTDDMRRIGMNDEAEVEAHAARRVNDDPADELRREDDDVDSHILRRDPADEARRESDDDEVEAHLKKA
jgi:hypothetical protein